MPAPPPLHDRIRSLGLIALTLLALLARRTDGPEAIAHSSESAGPGRFAATIEAAGHRWSYVVHAPPQYQEDRTWPLVVALHGSGGSGSGFLDDAGWAELADREGVLVVAPDGLPMHPHAEPALMLNPRLWNSGQHPPDRPRSRIDDLAFFDAMLDEVASRWRVDPDRVYVAGHSSGGAMALRLGAERSGTFAAVASVAALRYVEPPADARPVSMLAIFGGADPLLPTEGGLSVLPWEVRRTSAILPELRRWSGSLGCPGMPVAFEHDGTVHRFTYPPGREGAILSVLLLDGHGHAWPGGRPRPAESLLIGPRTDAIDATATIWGFFAPCRRPGASAGG